MATEKLTEEKNSFDSEISSNLSLNIECNANQLESSSLRKFSKSLSVSMILVNGYIHGIQKMLIRNKQIIPNEICKLIYLFYYQRCKMILWHFKADDYYLFNTKDQEEFANYPTVNLNKGQLPTVIGVAAEIPNVLNFFANDHIGSIHQNVIFAIKEHKNEDKVPKSWTDEDKLAWPIEFQDPNSDYNPCLLLCNKDKCDIDNCNNIAYEVESNKSLAHKPLKHYV